YAELRAATGISKAILKKRFRSLADALRKAGLEPSPAHIQIRSEDLLNDWGAVARKMGRVPSSNCYGRAGRDSRSVFYERFGSWRRAPAEVARWADESGTREQWKDVLEMIEQRRAAEKEARENGGSAAPEQAEAGMRRRHPVYPERPVHGAP